MKSLVIVAGLIACVAVVNAQYFVNNKCRMWTKRCNSCESRCASICDKKDRVCSDVISGSSTTTTQSTTSSYTTTSPYSTTSDYSTTTYYSTTSYYPDYTSSTTTDSSGFGGYFNNNKRRGGNSKGNKKHDRDQHDRKHHGGPHHGGPHHHGDSHHRDRRPDGRVIVQPVEPQCNGIGCLIGGSRGGLFGIGRLFGGGSPTVGGSTNHRVVSGGSGGRSPGGIIGSVLNRGKGGGLGLANILDGLGK